MQKKSRGLSLRWAWIGLGLLVALLFVLQPGSAQESKSVLKVATRILPPFVVNESGSFTGFSVELWNNISQELGKKSEFIPYPTVKDLLAAVEAGKADLGVAAISITADRERRFDFSHPILAAGLQVMIRSSGNNTPNLLSLIFSATFFQLLMVAIVLIIIAAHIIWLLERHHSQSIISKSYFPGIFKASWWAAATLATQADEMPKGPLGRMLAVLWMFIGVLFVAYFTATVTTSLTVQQLQGNIRDLSDLAGKPVATIANSTAANFLREQKLQVLEFAKIEQAYEALLQTQADAVVFDAPVLLYYAANEGKGKVELVGGLFREENYGIVLPKNSRDREPINNALLTLKEKGMYQILYDKWFKVN
jgi:polar amino acid transport system substrate-binding protein